VQLVAAQDAALLQLANQLLDRLQVGHEVPGAAAGLYGAHGALKVGIGGVTLPAVEVAGTQQGQKQAIGPAWQSVQHSGLMLVQQQKGAGLSNRLHGGNAGLLQAALQSLQMPPR